LLRCARNDRVGDDSVGNDGVVNDSIVNDSIANDGVADDDIAPAVQDARPRCLPIAGGTHLAYGYSAADGCGRPSIAAVSPGADPAAARKGCSQAMI
jgi:hypothetical protein